MTLLAEVLASTVASTARPAATLLVVQLLARWALHAGHATPSTSLGWAVGNAAIAVAAILTLLEYLLHREGTLARALRQAKVERAVSMAGTLAASLVFVTLGVPASGRTPDLAGATDVMVASTRPLWVTGPLVLFALGLNYAMGWARERLMERLEDLDLDDVWRTIENGGVAAVLLVLALSPVMAVVLALVAVGALGVASLTVRAWARARDRRARRPCPACGYAAREEASRCAGCKGSLEVMRRIR
jgi:hypothetical protein